MTVSAQYAATHFDELLSAAESGEEVRIDRSDKPGIRLVVENAPQPAVAQPTRPRILGALRGQIRVPTVEEWAEMDAQMWQTPERPRSELLGCMAGTVELGEDWDSPTTNKEIQDLFEGLESSAAASHS